MRILTSEQMRDADQRTFDTLGVPSRAVMEVAGREVARLLVDEFPQVTTGVVIFCGRGNNGGDGYVAARALLQLGVPTLAVSTIAVEQLAGEALAAFNSAQAAGLLVVEYAPEMLLDERLRSLISGTGVVVDAILGIGLRKGVSGELGELLKQVNELCAEFSVPIVAIDIPSGVQADSGNLLGEAIQADLTIAIQALKPGHVFFPASVLSGDVCVCDIGVEVIEDQDAALELVTEEVIASLVQTFIPLGRDAHKGTRGHVLVIGGGEGKVGAAKLSGIAAHRMGAGLVTLCLPQASATVVAPMLSELMCVGVEDGGSRSFSPTALAQIQTALQGKRAIVVGPGFGTDDQAAALFAELLPLLADSEAQIVLDADALTLLARRPELFDQLNERFVLTPHPGEMGRLLGVGTTDVESDRLAAARACARRANAVVVLKGARTLVAIPDGRCFVNPAAAPALATAGSGDALAGMIAALSAGGCPLVEATLAAVFVHGAAGEILELRTGGPRGVTATQILEFAPIVLNYLFQLEPLPLSTVRTVLAGSVPRVVELLTERMWS